ncbi:hypothetical protein [Streptomyces sp. 6N223]|uniref:hypothetical protein n=1 Tax=Streptomyces sp. 6N223 TaxID=3457412 RepID=UPI003FD5A1EE
MQIAPVLVASLAAGCALAALLMVVWPWQRRRAAVRRRAETARAESVALRKRLAEAERRERMLTEEIRHLATTRLPALARALRHAHVRVPGPRHQRLADSDAGRALASVLTSASAALMSERRRVDGAAQAAMRGATTKLQTMCYQMQTTVDEMLHKYDDPELAEQLTGLDYLNEQILRRLQVTRVVCGAGAGLVRTKSPLRGLVLGASSRIPSYERVQIVDHLPDPVAVVDRAAEPVAIVIAELLANAVHHSHGTLPVEVSLHQAHNGAVVVINDAGIGMNAEEFGKARRMLAGTEEVFLAELGDPPRSGFAAVGRLCRQYGLSVSLEPSHYAGVKAVVFVPAELLTTLDQDEQPPIPAGAPAPVRPSPAPATSPLGLAAPAVEPPAPPGPAAAGDPASPAGPAGPAGPGGAARPAGSASPNRRPEPADADGPSASRTGLGGEADGASGPATDGPVGPTGVGGRAGSPGLPGSLSPSGLSGPDGPGRVGASGGLAVPVDPVTPNGLADSGGVPAPAGPGRGGPGCLAGPVDPAAVSGILGVAGPAAPAGPRGLDGVEGPAGSAMAGRGDAAGGLPPPLPQRRHRRTVRASPEGEPGAALPCDPAEAAARMGALQRGTARGRAAARDNPAAHDEQDDSADPAKDSR